MSSLVYLSFQIMLSKKWKTYRVFNYILLAVSSIIFLALARQYYVFKNYDFSKETPEVELAFLAYGAVFLAMIGSTLINIIIMSKTFPDKLLNKSQDRGHIFSIILNVLAFAGLFFALITLLKEINGSVQRDVIPFLVMSTVLVILLVLLVFIFVCQLVLRKYLRSKNDVAISSMIDSIGKEN